MKTISKFSSYKKNNCFEICFYDHYKNVRNCSSQSDNFCEKYNECYLKFQGSFDLQKKCKASCSTECNVVNFKVNFESEDLLKEFSSHTHAMNGSIDRSRILEIFYQELR